MPQSQVSAAIILRTRAYGESDKIVTFLSADAGKLTGIAKGAKNSRRRFANCLEPFTRVQVHFRSRPGAGLVFIESCDLSQLPGVLIEPAKFAYGSYLIELVDQLTGEAHPVRELYDLLAEGLDELGRGAATAAFLRGFELRLLHHAGYGPRLRTCMRCDHDVLASERAFLDTILGGIICAGCRAADEVLLPITGITLSALEATRTTPLAVARTQALSPGTAAEAAQLMNRLLALHLARPLRSVKLIAALSQ
jgi:DNA repair protein RecO (recombination protein O)